MKTPVKMSLNRQGLSLVETMISVGILTVLIAGSMSAFSAFQKYIVLARAKTTLINMRNGVLERLRSDKTWDKSLRLSANTSCLWDGTDCNGDAFALSLCQEASVDLTDCLSDADVYSIDGTGNCVGDNMQCPFTVALTMPNSCAAANCHPTSVVVNYSVAVSPEFTAAYGALDLNKYSIIFNRNLGTLSESFSAVEVIGNVNSGACTAGTWIQRPLSRFLNNPDDNAAIAIGDLALVAGRYKCDVTVPAFAVNSFRIKVRDTVSGWESPQGTGYAQRTAASAGAQATATTMFDQSFANAANLRILFMAENCNVAELDAKGLKVPIAGGGYDETVLSIITCTRVF